MLCLRPVAGVVNYPAGLPDGPLWVVYNTGGHAGGPPQRAVRQVTSGRRSRASGSGDFVGGGPRQWITPLGYYNKPNVPNVVVPAGPNVRCELRT